MTCIMFTEFNVCWILQHFLLAKSVKISICNGKFFFWFHSTYFRDCPLLSGGFFFSKHRKHLGLHTHYNQSYHREPTEGHGEATKRHRQLILLIISAIKPSFLQLYYLQPLCGNNYLLVAIMSHDWNTSVVRQSCNCPVLS